MHRLARQNAPSLARTLSSSTSASPPAAAAHLRRSLLLRPEQDRPRLAGPSAPSRALTTASHAIVQPAKRPRLAGAQRGKAARHLSSSARLNSESTAAPGRGPTAAYNEQVTAGIIKNDDFQRGIVKVLQRLYDELELYDPEAKKEEPKPEPPKGMFAKWFAPPGKELSAAARGQTTQADAEESDLRPTLAGIASLFRKAPPPPEDSLKIPDNVPLGLYLYGDVGCGKSFLMDLFYAHLPEKWHNSRRRVHFHAFMMDVHKRGHKMRQELGPREDWIVPLAAELAAEARILCFDEFQVTDIADAMILRRLFEALMSQGVVAVMTSNRVPDDLYKNGIQREQFMPCIDLIKQRFVVQCLDSNIDYRRIPRALSKVYFHPLTEENRSEFNKLWTAMAHDEDIVPNRKLTVWGREIDIPESTEKTARFTFDELCNHHFSASDYLEITKTFGTIFLTDVPQLTLDYRDQARRFILFIDSCYEAKTKLFVLSDPPIFQMFSDKGTASDEISAHQRAIMDDLGLTAETVGASSIFTGDEEIFAFARAVSRITEMGSVQWAQQVATS